MTITIQGSAPRFNQQELDQRQASHRNMYLNTMESREAVRAEFPHLFLLNVIEKSNQGYVLDTKTPIRMDSLNYRAFMFKPDHMQTSDLQAADIKIKDAYIVELQSERERFKEMLKAQLIEADAIKEQKKLDIAKAKRLAEIVAEVEGTFSDLVIPD
ncbi:hypothetical protein [Pseudomonas gregormendelii]